MSIELNLAISASELYSFYSKDRTYKDETSFSSDLQWRNTSNIIGYPNTFNTITDPRIEGNRYGRVEFNTILKDAPLVFIQPGIPNFLDRNLIEQFTGSEDDKTIMNLIASGNQREVPSAIRSLEIKSGGKYDSRYYGFKPKYDSYIKFVNSMAEYVIIRMNLLNHKGVDTSMHNIKLLHLNSGGTPFTNSMLPIFCDASTTSFSEGSQNATGESMAGSYLNSSSQLVREAQFLFDGKLPIASDLLASNLNEYESDVKSIAGDMGSSVDGLLGKIKGGTSAILKGGMMFFPNIWQNSTYSKSYDIGIKLWSPYGDDLSIYNNIIFPLLCLLGLSLPRQTSRTAYASPFLVKVYSKGYFNCDLGMVESISINKGENKSWNKDNLPLEVDVKLTIKDMYPTLMLTIGQYGGIVGFNSPLADFLDTLCGVGVGEVDYLEGLQRMTEGVALNALKNIYSAISKVDQSLIAEWSKHAIGMVGDIVDLGEDALNKLTNDIFNNVLQDRVNGQWDYNEDDKSTEIGANGEELPVEVEGATEASLTYRKPKIKNRDKVIYKKY